MISETIGLAFAGSFFHPALLLKYSKNPSELKLHLNLTYDNYKEFDSTIVIDY